MSVIKVTLADKSVQEFPFERSSQVTVESTVQVDPTVTQRQSRSWSDIVSVEITDGATEGSLAEPELIERPGLASAEGALFFAKQLPVADAAAHVEQALALFPGDADLLAVQAELDDAVRSGAETWATDVGAEPEPEPVVVPVEVPEPTEAAKELAEANHVRISNVPGTGADGRVTKDDVERYLAERGR